jgi:hypothetical protein
VIFELDKGKEVIRGRRDFLWDLRAKYNSPETIKGLKPFTQLIRF